jgi:hypothetical protein
MKTKQFILAAALSIAATSTIAQTNFKTIGSQTLCNNANGTSSTTRHVDNQSYTNRSNRTSLTTQSLGDQGYINRSDGSSATVQRIGN